MGLLPTSCRDESTADRKASNIIMGVHTLLTREKYSAWQWHLVATTKPLETDYDDDDGVL